MGEHNPKSNDFLRNVCYIMLIQKRARPFIDAGIDFSNVTISRDSSKLCTQAASSCIQTGQLIHSHVPPSHYLAFCTHELAISGILLLVVPFAHSYALRSLVFSDDGFQLTGCARVPIALSLRMWFLKLSYAFSSSPYWKPYGLGLYVVA